MLTEFYNPAKKQSYKTSNTGKYRCGAWPSFRNGGDADC